MLAQIITENGQKKIIPLTADAGAGNPVGTIIPMYKKSNPSGYLYCNGSTFDETKYPLLYACLGSNVLPDYREFALVGAEQNTTDTIAVHDIYAQGEGKDDQLQTHTHYVSSASGGSATVFGLQYSTSGVSAKSGLQFGPATYGNFPPRIGDVTRGKRKAVYFYIKATSGLSENAQDNVVAQLNEQRSYSTEEHLTGRKWIDGKPIYSITVDCGTLPNNNLKIVAHNIANIDKIVKIEGISINTDNSVLPLPFASYLSATYNVQLSADRTQIALRTSTDRSNYTSTYVTLEYTKTTD